MKDSLLKNSLLLLSRFLQKNYGQKTILFIDEYDVLLDYAYRSGYYDDIVRLVRTLFGAVFKTNDSMEFAVLTGCIGYQCLALRAIRRVSLPGWTILKYTS